ncbi:MAG TPA: NAD-dependent epimerase/dehydratase family protein, partial [Acidimicrobiia bacterium]|nr:NAD-dependent epimerase/dehydratase family protein [Acidimicrobiia bacterium]
MRLPSHGVARAGKRGGLGPRGGRGRARAMRVLLTGGTGFIGDPLVRALRGAGHDVVVVSRQPGRVPWRSIPWDRVRETVREIDAVVNL